MASHAVAQGPVSPPTSTPAAPRPVPAQPASPTQPPPSQDARQNPFLPVNTAEEDRRIADRERMKGIVRDLFPELRSMLQGDFNTLRGQVDDAKRGLEDTKKQISDLAAKNAQLPAQGTPQPATPATPKGPKLPEGAKFIGCVNGKALYRDGKQGFSFTWTGAEAEVFGCDAR
ncbi:hypothetical protein OCUBac02_51220 (plasmid) [Bosea sp. ANAM02]|nr:hypothetical protein OCUBac02_51220 [Bosea sp. ANAM02]